MDVLDARAGALKTRITSLGEAPAQALSVP
jgi:hypothetical protein